MNQIDKYVTWALNIANDDTHGYSQVNRWSPDYDCSSFVISALEYAGFRIKSNGGSYTGNLMSALLRCGFKLVQDKTLQRGDILLTHTDARQHTAIYVGEMLIVHARGASGHPESGDQTGTEICMSSYYPFEMTFRYPLKEKIEEVTTVEMKVVNWGCTGHEVKVLQLTLNQFGNFFLEVDGIAKDKTIQALKIYQRKNNLVVDGICGQNTWNKLLRGV